MKSTVKGYEILLHSPQHESMLKRIPGEAIFAKIIGKHRTIECIIFVNMILLLTLIKKFRIFDIQQLMDVTLLVHLHC